MIVAAINSKTFKSSYKVASSKAFKSRRSNDQDEEKFKNPENITFSKGLRHVISNVVSSAVKLGFFLTAIGALFGLFGAGSIMAISRFAKNANIAKTELAALSGLSIGTGATVGALVGIRWGGIIGFFKGLWDIFVVPNKKRIFGKRDEN